MSEQPTVVRATDATVTSLTFEGWLVYDADDPESYPFISLYPVGGTYRPTASKPSSDTTVAKRIRVVVPL